MNLIFVVNGKKVEAKLDIKGFPVFGEVNTHIPVTELKKKKK